MPAAPQRTQVNPDADFDTMILGLPPVDGVPFSLAHLEHDADRWFIVDPAGGVYNTLAGRFEVRTTVSLYVRIPGETRPDGWEMVAWGPRPATREEILSMAQSALDAYAEYGDDDMAAPERSSRIRLT